MRRDVFQAISDPTRRAIITLIASRSITLNSVTEEFDISRQAIAKHVKILTECGLVVIHSQGKERLVKQSLTSSMRYRIGWNHYDKHGSIASISWTDC